MTKTPHLVLDLSAHGYGHLAQAAPVIAALRASRPGVRVTVRTSTPSPVVEGFLGPVDFAPAPPEAVPAMTGPDVVDATETFRRFSAYHADWDDKVATEAEALRGLAPDLLLADAPYLSLAAAKRAGVPAVGYSSLNWADIAEAYLPEGRAAARNLEIMREAYQAARAFIVPEPGLEMAWLNPRRVGPVARVGRSDPAGLRRALGLAVGIKTVLVSFGGIAGRSDIDWLPRIAGVHWILGGGLEAVRADTSAASDLDWNFADLLASCMLVIAKPGYGIFVEVAATGGRLLFTERPDWPEYAGLRDWVSTRATAEALPRDGLRGTELARAVEALLSRPTRPAVAPEGAAQAADILLGFL